MVEDKQQQSEDNTVEKQVKDTAKNVAKNTFKAATKKIAMTIANAIVSLISAILPYIAIIVVVAVIVCGFSYILELITAEDITNNIYESMEIMENDGDISEIVVIKSDSKGYHLEFVEDFDDKLEAAIKKLNRENDSITISDKETLKEFIMAEAMTKYPDLGGESDGDSKFQGTVKIKRVTPDKNIGQIEEAGQKEITLKYVEKETFDSYVQNNDNEALNVFTFDENKNIITATWSYSSENGNSSVSIEENSPMDYRAATSAYTMPFEYPLFFLIDGDDEDFCIKLAELAMNSSMEITIVDNVTTTKTVTSIHTLREKTEEKYTIDENGNENYDSTSTSNITDQTDITELIAENTSSSIILTNVDAWTAKKSSKISNTTSSSESTDEKIDGPTTTLNRQPFGGSNDDKYYVTIDQTITTTVTNEVYTNGFDVTESEVEDNSKYFVDLYKNHEKKLNNDLLPDWLFEIMENNGKTSNLIEVTKYLLYKATGKDYGVTDFSDLELFTIIDMDFVGTENGTVSIFGISITREEFVSAAKKYQGGSYYNTYMAAYAGDFYDVCKEYNINPTYTYAHACLETGFGSSDMCRNKKNYFGMNAYNTNVGAASSYASVKDSVRDYCKWVVQHSTAGTSEYNADYARGQEFAKVLDIFSGTPQSNIYVLYSRYAVLNSTHGSGFGSPDWFYRETGKGNCGHASGSATTLQEYAEYSQYTTDQRISIAKNIFGTKAFPSTGNGSGAILEKAEEIMQYMIKNNYDYVQGNVVPLEDNEKKNGKRVDCSSFVCWVLYRCGYTDAHSGGHQLNTDSLPPYLENKKFKKVTSLNDLKEGDIVFFPGHVQIYAGKNSSGTRQYINAGVAPKGQNLYQTYEPTGFLYAYRAQGGVSKGNITNGSGDGYNKTYKVGTHEYKLYEQWMGSYSGNSYGSATISSYGCGPSSVSIILSGYGYNLTPGGVVSDCKSITNNYGIGTLDAVKGYLKKYGMNVEQKGNYGVTIRKNQQDEIINHLKGGNPVILLVQGPVILSNGGRYNYTSHYITLLGINENNEVFVGDPGSRNTDGYTTINSLTNNSRACVYYLISK